VGQEQIASNLIALSSGSLERRQLILGVGAARSRLSIAAYRLEILQTKNVDHADSMPFCRGSLISRLAVGDWVDAMQTKGDPWNETFYLRAIQTKIGQSMRAQYDLTQPLPHRLLTLLMQLDEPPSAKHAATKADQDSGSATIVPQSGRTPEVA
jgi:hypothetical protein